jgi:hypothetical protein
MLYAFRMPKLDRQLDALTEALEDFDPTDAQRELAAVEAQVASLNERASLLRALLEMKRTSTAYRVTVSGGVRTTFAGHRQNGKPKTRDAILAYFEAAGDGLHDVPDVRTYLRTLGINVTDEAIRQNLRGLNDDGVLDRPDLSHYKLSPSWANQE